MVEKALLAQAGVCHCLILDYVSTENMHDSDDRSNIVLLNILILHSAPSHVPLEDILYSI